MDFWSGFYCVRVLFLARHNTMFEDGSVRFSARPVLFATAASLASLLAGAPTYIYIYIYIYVYIYTHVHV